MNNNNSQFDKKLHDRLSTEELPFDPLAWEMMEEKLDDEPKRGFLLWFSSYKFLMGVFSILLLATITYWSFHNNNFQDRGHSEVVSINDSMSNPTIDIHTTSDSSTYTIIPSAEISSSTNNKIKSASTSVISTQHNSAAIEKSVFDEANNVVTRKSVNKNVNKKEQQSNNVSSYDPKIEDTDKNTADIINVEQTKISESVHSPISEEIETINNKEIEELSILSKIASSIFTYSREVDLDLKIIEIEEKIDRPKHQINMTVGAGMTQLDIDDPFVGDITPTAISNKEVFLSLSYLYRVHRNWGIEGGAQAAYQTQSIAHYFEAGDYGLSVSEYSKVNFSAYEGKYELFGNVHFFLPLNQRSEIDIYGGFYALNPFSSSVSWGGGSGTPSFLNNNDITLMRTRANGERGIYNGGRVKLGINYNFLTNKLNNVGIGIAYMHQINNEVEGTYALIQTTEEAAVAGNLRANPSGFKVQLTYGFGLKRLPWAENKLKRPSPKTPWYMGIRYGTKNYILSDELSRDLVNPIANRYQSIIIGHYINQKVAFEFGLENYEFTYSTPFNENFLLRSQKFLSVPFALRYDVIQTNRFSLYGKGVFSTDFRIRPSSLSTFATGEITDKDKLLLNAGIEAGIDFRIVKGVNIGFVGKYNQAFSRAALSQYPELSAQNEIVFRDINLKNTYFSWGVELKYLFNRQNKG